MDNITKYALLFKMLCAEYDGASLGKKVLATFEHKSAMELEALSTMDYVANSLLGEFATESDIKRKFKEIKGSKFNDTVIRNTYQELVDLKLIAG